ncbi:replication protein A 70 kDa DNA-binding subunit A [Morus notabilis]|uniref:replication protein A 70 kDa DNA-binding subunit A n=1 Tax=Morus notabilis TaxID=981085 RepID=UPI000CED0663|nr:replication protein A 70 kDa DNA-binding subunit A [Morus notabilis]
MAAAALLTEGAMAKMCSDEFAKEEGWKPVVQVTDVKKIQADKERYRVIISDGRHQLQGMINLSLNNLIREGKLQSGSIIRLTDFVCSPVQTRQVVVIVNLELIRETCEIIGQPVTAPKAGTSPFSGSVNGNSQPVGGSTPSADAANEAAVGMSGIHPGVNRPHGSTYSSNLSYGSANTTSTFPKSVSGSYNYTGTANPAPVSGSYGNQNLGFRNSRPEVSRPPPNSYGRTPQPAYQQPPPMYGNRGPVVKTEASARIIPIAALNPYQGRWTIKARVTAKGDLRHYNNPRGEGKVFSFDLLDSEGGEIRATCFNAVADQFYSQIEVDKIYMISRGSLKPARKNFNHLRNDQEIFLESTSVIQPCFEDDNSIPHQQFHFCPITDVEGMENNGVIDLIGIVSYISPAGSIMRKNGTETQKRTLQLRDMSGCSVEFSLWGSFCNEEGQTLQNMCDSGVFPVLAVKSGRINDFNGKSVGTISSSQLLIEPDFPEARKLKEWFATIGRNTPSVSISKETGSVGKADIRKTISQIKDEKLGTSDKPDWITVCATITFIKVDNFCYTACPEKIGDRQCNKKVTNNGDGKWRCDRCDKSVEECEYRYILQLQIQDHTGLTWVTAFQEGGEEIMGVSAKSLYYLKYEEHDDEKFAEIIRKVLFTKFIFKLKVKEETYSDEQRVKSTVVKADKVSYSSESRFLLDLMEKLRREDSGSASKVESTISNHGIDTPGVTNIANRQQPTPVDFGNTANAGRDFGAPANRVGQYGNQYSGSRFSATASSGMHMSCNSCGATGHSSMNCPSIVNSPGQSHGGIYDNRAFSGPNAGNASGECFKCHQPGHWARDCPSTVNSPGQSHGGIYDNRAFSGPNAGNASGECFKCHQPGHWARDCPGSSDIPPSYGSSGVVPGRYGGARQQVGGY